MAVAQLPSGVVTFFMTDVEGSTRLWEDASKAMAAAMRRHDQIAEEVVQAEGGSVIKDRGEGDALFCVFPSAVGAVRSAVELQHRLEAETWPTPRPIRIRIALHAGEAELRQNDYYGPVINRCARLRAICHGRQIVVSEAVRLLAPSAVEYLDLGLHRLKDLTTPENVFQVIVPGLPTDFPPLTSLGNRPNNLPKPITSFVGREAEVREVVELLTHKRLVNLLGAGGTGKTRLALQVAESSLESFPGGVWWLELDRIQDGSRVWPELAELLRVTAQPGQSALDALGAHLAGSASLIVLDNCEHVLPDAAKGVGQLLASAVGLKILATSREPLGVMGEHAYRVPTLSVPGDEEPFERMAEHPSLKLFAERAHAVRPEFQLSPDNARQVALICRQLDGIPFAIELAAARARSMPVDVIAERIEDRFRLLGKGDSSRSARQQTLHNLVEWSYGLLNAEEQLALCRLSVFVRSADLGAAEEIVGTDPVDPYDVIELLASLADKSLIQLDDDGRRYRMLETIRAFGRQKLMDSGEWETSVRAHSVWFAQQAEQIGAKLNGADPKEGFDRVDQDLENFRQALATLRDTDRRAEVETVLHLFRYFDARALFAEPRQRLEDALPSLESPSDQLLLARALQALGNLYRRQGDLPKASNRLEEARKLYHAMNMEAAEASTLLNLATIYLHQGRNQEAEDAARPASQVFAKLGEPRALISAYLILGNLQAQKGDMEAAISDFQAAKETAEKQRLPDLLLYARSNLGLAQVKNGQPDLALAEFEQLIPAAHQAGQLALALEALRFSAQAATRTKGWALAYALYTYEGWIRDQVGVKLSERDQLDHDSDLSVIREHVSDSAPATAGLTLHEAFRRGADAIQSHLAEQEDLR